MTMSWWIVQTACICALLAAVVALAGRVARLSPAVKHALWLLVLVKLITPPLASYRVPLAAHGVLASWTSGAPLASAQESPGGSFPPSFAQDTMDRQLVRAYSEVPVALAPTSGADSAETAPLLDSTPFDLPPQRTTAETEVPTAAAMLPIIERLERDGPRLLFAGWLVGAIVFTTVHGMRLIRLRRFLKHSMPAPAWLDQLVRQLAGTLNVRPPQIVVSPVLCSPLVCALGRPKLLWPAALGEQLPKAAREAVLLHELAHLRRRDHWVAWLELAAGVVWWFNPLYWYVCHQLRENAELACDAWVVGLRPTSRRAYALALIEVTEFVSLAPAATPAVAMGNVARHALERRLTMILRERIAYRVPLLGTALIGLSLLAVLPGWSGGQVPATGEKAPSADSAPLDAGFLRSKLALPADLPQSTSDASAAKTNGPAVETRNPLVAPAPGTTSDRPALEPPSALTRSGIGDDRISQLEAKLTQLLAEVQAVRRAGGPPSMRPQASQPSANQPGKMGAAAVAQLPNTSAPQGAGQPPMATGYPRAGYSARTDWQQFQHAYGMMPWGQGADPVEALTRAKYKLTEATATALASFIKEHVKSEVDTKVDGDTLTVIASAEDQAKIGAFVDLLRGKPAAPGPAGLPGGDAKSTSAHGPLPEADRGSAPQKRGQAVDY